MAKAWPALDVRGPMIDAEADLLLAAIDDCSPTAVEEREAGVRIFFATADAREAAIAIVCSATLLGSRPPANYERVDVSDEDWAERSQHNLAPVTVGRITIFPSPQSSIINRQSSIHLVVPPSMAFGTGHHATTRLCLAALQTIDLDGAFVIDAGTGSGVLALAAAALGARRAIGIDNDPDAIAAARENLARNPSIAGIEFFDRDLRALAMLDADVVTANLTGPVLAAQSTTLAAALRPGGHLIVSGVLTEEFDGVARAIGATATKMWVADEDGWIGARFVKI